MLLPKKLRGFKKKMGKVIGENSINVQMDHCSAMGVFAWLSCRERYDSIRLPEGAEGANVCIAYEYKYERFSKDALVASVGSLDQGICLEGKRICEEPWSKSFENIGPTSKGAYRYDDEDMDAREVKISNRDISRRITIIVKFEWGNIEFRPLKMHIDI